MLTFALGAYTLAGDLLIAAALAVATAATLAFREPIHGWVRQITWPELRSGLVLLAMTFIVLPILPAEPIGPLGGVDLREVWLIAIMLAGVSFVGYVAVKYFGTQRGILSRRSRRRPCILDRRNDFKCAASRGRRRFDATAFGGRIASQRYYVRACGCDRRLD